MKRFTIFFVILLSIGFTMNTVAQKTPEALGWKLAVGSYSFRLFTFEESLEKADSLGLKYIEMATSQKIGGGIEGTTRFTMDKMTRKAILKMAAKHGIKIISYGVITGNDDDEWEAIFEFAKDMGIETILSEPKLEQLDFVEKLANKYKINLAIHNHAKPSFYWNPEVVLDAINGRSQRIGSCADIGHWVRSGLDPIECMKMLEGRIIEFHFKDMNEKTMKAKTVIWGTGICDIKGMLQEMKRQNFKGEIGIEYESNWENNTPEIRESIKNFISYTKEL